MSTVFLGHQPHAHPKMFETFYMLAHSMRNNSPILHGDQTRCDENLYMVDHECWCAICSTV